jgi:formyl-CoA transferase
MSAPARPAAATDGPLSGVRVVELGMLIAGPFTTRLLGDLGADVIKVESPARPDPMRNWGTLPYKDTYLMWTVFGRNKRCITLNLRTDAGRDLLLQLLATADVLVENFQPGTLEGWGLGPEVLQATNPRLVVARVSGYGQTGPYAGQPGFASVAEGISGMRYINGSPGQPPPRTGLSLGDSLASMFAVQGILAALYEREQSGLGQVVDVALTEACLALLESIIPEYDRTGHVRQPSGTRLDGNAPSNIYQCSDGAWIVIAANQDALFARLCTALGQPELATDPRFIDHHSRGRNQDEIDAIIGAWVAQHDSAHALAHLAEHQVVSGPVNTIADVMADPQFRARDMFVPHFDERLGEDVLGPGVVPKFSRTPGAVRWAGRAVVGADNGDVFAALGLTDDDLAALRDQGVI